MLPLSVLGILFIGALGVHQRVESQDIPSSSTSHYDSIGPYQVVNGLSSTEKTEIETRIRGFLWEHLEGKVPAKLEVTFYTIEGEPTHYLFLVDSDQAGEWRIRSTVTMLRGDYAHPKRKPKQIVVQENYCHAGRIDPADKKAIPIEEKRDPKSYRLVLTICTDRDVTF